ncbi:MAG TPA: alpha/beta fold hydrolase, partial [Thermoanaerobaculia bacterium]|nr:alpha/beta fold hydrolase [Thermoanaerobaculia bacterium]
GNITERAPEATEIARRGISVLLFDWRGYGKSEGTPSESALFDDALAAYDFARTQTNDIVLYGESLGGPYAAYVATKRKARCLIIENSFPSLAAIGNALYRPLPLGMFAPFALTTTRWLNRAGLPVLVMHGKRDAVIPFQLGVELFDGLTVRKEMLVSETAGHCEIAAAEGERYYDTLLRFIRSTSPASN